MCPAISTHFLPGLCEPGVLAGATAVVIDVLRASTTICHALDAGATAVIPFGEIEQANEFASRLSGQDCVRGGERGGKLIDGFDLDNSPSAYTRDSVGGKVVLFTTTNGTRAMLHCREADRILIGSFNNFSALISQLLAGDGPIHLMCAGTAGQISQEDILFAGAVAEALTEEINAQPPHDATAIAIDYFLLNSEEMLMDALMKSHGGRNLQKLNMSADIERAAELDRFDFVPEYSNQTGRITVSSPW